MADPASPPPEPTAAAAPAASMPEAAPAAPGDATEAAGELTLPEVLATASAWGLALTKHLDQRSRVSLARASRGCWLWALEATPQVTVTLSAHSALTESAWQARLAAATQALADRGADPRLAETARGTKLLLRVLTPKPAAVRSVLTLPPAAGKAVTELEVQRYSYPAPSKPHPSTTTTANPPPQSLTPTTAGPQSPPPLFTFTNLHTFTINPMTTPLPNPALLPSLRELHVHLWLGRQGMCEADRAAVVNSVVAQCVSIGEYVWQLTTLGMFGQGGGGAFIYWPDIFPTTTNTLTSFTSTCGGRQQMLREVLRAAPSLQCLGCHTHRMEQGFSDRVWPIRELRCLGLHRIEASLSEEQTQERERWCKASDLALWPQSAGKLRLMPYEGDTLYIDFDVVDDQVRNRCGDTHTHAHTYTHIHIHRPLALSCLALGHLGPA